MISQKDAKTVALTIVGSVLAAYTIKCLKKKGWL